MFKRSGVWWTCIRHNGRKIQKSLDTSEKKLAKAIEAKVRTEIVEGSYFEKLIGTKKTFKDMMEKFMKEHAPKVSINMQSSYTASLKHLRPYFKDANLTSITPKMISRYKILRRDGGAKPASIQKELAMLSKAFSMSVKEWEWLQDNPVSKVQNEKLNNEIDRWLTDEEEIRLLGNCPEWLSEIVVFCLHTGLRKEELLSLEWSRVNLIRRTVLIKETKNGKPKTLPLNKVALGILDQRSKVRSIKNDLVFFTSKGTKFTGYNIRRSFNDALEKAGIENFRFHDLRHSFATRLAQAGVDLYKISKLLGHKDIKMTQRYAHHCPDSLRDGVEMLEADYNLTTMAKNNSVNACSNQV
ncbi:MAG: tyrosine-type recombinase/integrase [Planctomycetota bacterium]|jgi:site-specific recombinase XerD